MPASIRHRTRRAARLRAARNIYVDSETLFAMAAEAASQSAQPRVSLPLPFKSKSLVPDKRSVKVVEIPGKGRGVMAKAFIPEGTTICCEKAICMIMDWESDDMASHNEEIELEPLDNTDTARMVLRLVQLAHQKPDFWYESGLCHLFPRSETEAKGLEQWTCCDTFLDAAVRHATRAMNKKVRGNWSLLPLIVRHNAIDVTTNGEMLSYPASELANLAGLALYGWRPSSFNHSRRPNVARWHVGDVGVWRTNRDVRAGEELCVSYCESALLYEDSTALRKEALSHLELKITNNSEEIDKGCHSELEDEDEENSRISGSEYVRLLDENSQNRWMTALTPKERISAFKKLRPSLLCDKIELHILKAVTFAQLAKAENARREFIAAFRLCKNALPPNDEQTIVVAFHAARAALASHQVDHAAVLLREALLMHKKIFGGGMSLFRMRFANDAVLQLGYSPDTHVNDLAALLEDHLDEDFVFEDDDDEDEDDNDDQGEQDDSDLDVVEYSAGYIEVDTDHEAEDEENNDEDHEALFLEYLKRDDSDEDVVEPEVIYMEVDDAEDEDDDELEHVEYYLVD